MCNEVAALKNLGSGNSVSNRAKDMKPQCQFRPRHCMATPRFQSVYWAAGNSHAFGSQMRRRLEDVAVQHGRRGAGGNRGGQTGTTRSSQPRRLREHGAARPNLSFEARPNGKPPGPGRWHTVHSHRPGPGVLPSVPPQLKR